VDVNFNVTERSTGSIQLGAGYSSSDKLVLSAGVSQNNIFGTGNALSLNINTGKTQRTTVIAYTNPYWTEDGVSRGFDIFDRKYDASQFTGVAPYVTRTLGAGVRFGVPLNEQDTVNLRLGLERTKVQVFTDRSPPSPTRFIQFVNNFGERTTALLGEVGWSRDTRDSVFYPTRGRYQRISGEVGLPGGDLTYYKITYQHQWLAPLSQNLSLSLNGELGEVNGYNQKDVPFFKNFYAGGVGSVRGYQTSSLGPKDNDGLSTGGTRKLIGSAELLFPVPGMRNDKSVRLSVFVDGGNVYNKGDSISLSTLRYSTGVALSWFSPVGPLKLSLGIPLRLKPDDKVERLQFMLGTVF
jgi:outer membrane protein insertion porin family